MAINVSLRNNGSPLTVSLIDAAGPISLGGSADGVSSVSGAIQVFVLYSKGAVSSLPTNTAPLNTAFSLSEISNISSDDGVRTELTGIEYLVQQFKKIHTDNSSPINISWNGQASVAPSVAPVSLQIYNVNSSSWETLASNNSAIANADFNLSGSKTTNVANYYDSNQVVSVRVYQNVGAGNETTFQNSVGFTITGNSVLRDAGGTYFGVVESAETKEGDGFWEFKLTADGSSKRDVYVCLWDGTRQYIIKFQDTYSSANFGGTNASNSYGSYEGDLNGSGWANTTSTYKFSREAGNVKVYKDGSLVYTFSTSSSGTLRLYVKGNTDYPNRGINSVVHG